MHLEDREVDIIGVIERNNERWLNFGASLSHHLEGGADQNKWHDRSNREEHSHRGCDAGE